MTDRLWRPPLLVVSPATVHISPQQANVLSGLCRGPGMHRIATDMGVSIDTAKTHAKRLYRALDATCAAHAVALACSGQVHLVVTDERRQSWERAS
jgi:DNA-binding NarL/FixJ family response regulator